MSDKILRAIARNAGIQISAASTTGLVERALISLGKTELSKMIEEQEKSEVTCQFCDKIYEFTRPELQELLAHASEKK